MQAVLLDANPILEAFGNAKTLRNHNSSRFGKWVDIHFDAASGAICGGRVRTYLLEKSRAVAVPAGERSFHVFYQLLAHTRGALASAAVDLALPSAADFAYLNGSGGGAPCVLNVPGLDDAAHGAVLEAALSAIGLDGAAELAPISRALAASLLLGNIVFITGEDGAATVEGASAATALSQVAAALGVDADALASALTHKRLMMRGETRPIISPRTADQAADVRDSLAKALFGGLFGRLVERINHHLAPSDVVAPAHSEVGVLDIFGFESFATNSFEQLCINFANEKLQGQFNGVVFEEQRKEYEEEGVPWRGGGHASNAGTLALLEGKLGILPLLHEQCRLPSGDDINFAKAVRKAHVAHRSFDAPRLHEACFGVRHYAGLVTYTSTGFVHKNRCAQAPSAVHAQSSAFRHVLSAVTPALDW